MGSDIHVWGLKCIYEVKIHAWGLKYIYEVLDTCMGSEIHVWGLKSMLRFCGRDAIGRKAFSIQEPLLRRNVKRFREGLVFQAHRLLNHSVLGSRVIKRK